MKTRLFGAVCVCALMFAVSTSASAALLSRLGGQAIYDSDRNITWLANANLAASNTFGVAGINPDGSMTWATTRSWIAAMNAANYLGYSDWRLPTTLEPDATCGTQWDGGAYGMQSGGNNCTGSEMGHLFYNELGGMAGSDITLVHNANYSLFSNIQSGFYWSGTEYTPLSHSAWTFFFGASGGGQSYGDKTDVFRALAVRSGDAAAVAGYTITDLGTLGGTWSYPLGINSNGQVVGFAPALTDPSYHPFLYSGGQMIDLCTFGCVNGIALGINNNGQVVGTATMTANAANDGFLYSGGQLIDLGIPGASGINDSGQILTGNGAGHAAVYSGGAVLDLGTLGGTYSYASSINSTGQVVGSSSTTGDIATHAFLYSGGPMIDLGTLGGTTSYAYGINNNGQIVGTANTAANASHAFLYSGNQMLDLGTFGGTYSGAYGINSSGLVVGAANLPGDAESHAFIYNGTMQDLNSLLPPGSGWVLEEAAAINDIGQITGHGSINGEHHGFLMTPVQSISPIVFIPGIMGSRLYDDQNNPVWPEQIFGSIPDQISNRFVDLKLGSGTNLQPGAGATGLIGTMYPGKIYSVEVYSKWLDALRQQENDESRWAVVPYDWRQAPGSQTTRVETAINDLYGRTHEKVLIVAHSMGSLLAKTTLASNPALADKIKAIVFVAAPQLGAPEALGTLLHGIHELSDHTSITGVNQANLRYVVNNMPGAYVLAPSETYFGLNNNPLFTFKIKNSPANFPCAAPWNYPVRQEYIDLCNRYNGAITSSYQYKLFLTDLRNPYTSILNVTASDNDTQISLPAILNSVLYDQYIGDLHGLIDQPQYWNANNIKIYQIVGVKFKTTCEIDYEFGQNGVEEKPVPCNQKLVGDGTVPANSANATPSAALTFYVDLSKASCISGLTALSHITHGSIMAARSVQDEIFSIARGAPTATVSSDCPLSEIFSPSHDPYMVLTIHSPVYFSVIDSAGHMTGNYPDGQVKEEILGSRFMSLGESRNIFLDANQSYRLEMIGIKNGTAGFSATLFDENGQKLEETNYEAIPVISGMKISTNFTSAKDLNTLPIDINGDGTVDKTINPVSCSPVTACVVGVPINIRSGKKHHPINLDSDGKIQVAILTTGYFDAINDVDRATLTFGHTGNELSLSRDDDENKPACRIKDMNGDGLPDLICRFSIQKTGLMVGDTEAVLRGKKLDGAVFEGRGAITVIKKKHDGDRDDGDDEGNDD